MVRFTLPWSPGTDATTVVQLSREYAAKALLHFAIRKLLHLTTRRSEDGRTLTVRLRCDPANPGSAGDSVTYSAVKRDEDAIVAWCENEWPAEETAQCQGSWVCFQIELALDIEDSTFDPVLSSVTRGLFPLPAGQLEWGVQCSLTRLLDQRLTIDDLEGFRAEVEEVESA